MGLNYDTVISIEGSRDIFSFNVQGVYDTLKRHNFARAHSAAVRADDVDRFILDGKSYLGADLLAAVNGQGLSQIARAHVLIAEGKTNYSLRDLLHREGVASHLADIQAEIQIEGSTPAGGLLAPSSLTVRLTYVVPHMLGNFMARNFHNLPEKEKKQFRKYHEILNEVKTITTALQAVK